MKLKRKSKEYVRFERALGRVLQTSKSELNKLLEEEKLANRDKPKPGPKPKVSSASDRVSGEGRDSEKG